MPEHVRQNAQERITKGQPSRIALCRFVCYTVVADAAMLTLCAVIPTLPNTRGGDAMMVTFSDLFQFCLLLIAFAELILKISKRK